MRWNRRRSDRPAPARNSLGSELETLERRELLANNALGSVFAQYVPNDLFILNPMTRQPLSYSVQHSLATNPSPTNPNLINEGKIVSGKDRQGNEWTITVHGPGTVIVTDATPNDGSLDDDIDTIQLINTNINQTYVTGTVIGSFRVQTDSTVRFNKLVATTGVNSIQLNGFNLAQTVAPPDGSPNNVNTGIQLLGGVRHLEFNNVLAPIDTSTQDAPINIVIGDSSTPLKIQPSIKINSIYNTVFDSSTSQVPANTPQTDPTVQVIVNGQIRNMDLTSATADSVPAAFQYQFPKVGTTGRTSVQALGINSLNVNGAATNFTASRSAQPFQNGFTGLARLNQANFRGPTDAVGLDVNGPINSLRFKRGISNPNNLFVGQTAAGPQVPATQYGLPAADTSYAGAGYVGGQVTAKRIGSLQVGPSNFQTQTPINPDFVQLNRQGSTYYVARPGNAMTNALISSSGNIGHTQIVGASQNSEITSGYHYGSFATGLVGARAGSRIGPYHQNGDLINSVTSATVRPGLNKVYGAPGTIKGPGTIRGNSNGALVNTGAITPLTNVGAGYFARTKTGGYLPPPTAPTRNAAGRLV